MSFFILGSTGLVGNEALKYASTSSSVDAITTLSRRAPSITGTKINAITEANSDVWRDIILKEAKDTKVFLSAFGTTRGAAGSAENFRKIDYGINYEAAKAAKEAGVETFVLISSYGANANSFLLYPSTTGKLEDDIIALKFPRTIILRPGVLLGARETSKGFMNKLAEHFGKFVYNTRAQVLAYPVYGEDLGKISVNLANEPLKGDPPIVDIVSAGTIVELAAKLKN